LERSTVPERAAGGVFGGKDVKRPTSSATNLEGRKGPKKRGEAREGLWVKVTQAKQSVRYRAKEGPPAKDVFKCLLEGNGKVKSRASGG